MTTHETLIRSFADLTLRHHQLDLVYEQLQDLDRPSYQEKVIVLTGPTGVGKSTICRRIVQDMMQRFASEMIEDPSFIPVVYLRIPAPINGDFNWKDAFIRLLEQFNETLIGRKVIQAPVLELDGEVVSNANKLARDPLRRSARNCIRHRRTRLLIIDEASHLLISKSRSFFHQQFETIKSLTQDFGIPLLLSGAYDLLNIRDFNGQLTRRTKVIHFPRYQWQEVDDPTNTCGQSFQSILYTLLEKMPIEKGEGLLEHVDFFYLNTLGCVGIMKDWLQSAFERALKDGGPLTREILAATATPGHDLLTISREIRQGESRLAAIDDEDLARSLGMDVVPDLFGSSRKISVPSATNLVAARSKQSGRLRPGTRNPSRDLVGGTVNAG
jgi:DNA replication protein DnaC